MIIICVDFVQFRGIYGAPERKGGKSIVLIYLCCAKLHIQDVTIMVSVWQKTQIQTGTMGLQMNNFFTDFYSIVCFFAVPAYGDLMIFYPDNA